MHRLNVSRTEFPQGVRKLMKGYTYTFSLAGPVSLYIFKTIFLTVAVRNAVDAVQKTITLFHKTRPTFLENEKNFGKWNSSISDMLLALRNKIEETRHLANGVLTFFLHSFAEYFSS